MTAPTHILIGLSGVVLCGHVAELTPSPLGLFAVIVGSLAPDIDGEGSIKRPGFLIKPFIGWRLANALDAIFEVFARLIARALGHRGFLHAPLLGLAFLVVGSLAGMDWLYWFGLGYALHIYGDYMTYFGVPVFSPFSKRTYSGCNLRVGSTKEKMLAGLMLPAVIVAGWPLLPTAVKEAHQALFNLI